MSDRHFQMEEIAARIPTSDPTDFSPKIQAVLLNLLLQLADNKYVLGRRYAEWANSAPLLEAAVAAAAMTQDELGHARSIYPLFRTFPEAPPTFKKAEERDNLVNITFLDTPFRHWVDFVAANFLFDQALSVMFETAQHSVFEPLRQRAEKILQEETYHAMFATTWLRSLSKKGTKARQAMTTALQNLWPEVICWLGRPGEKHQQYAIDEGLIAADVETIRRNFLQRVGPVLQELDYDLPFRYDQAGDQWLLSGALPWDRWDPKTRRLSSEQ